MAHQSVSVGAGKRPRVPEVIDVYSGIKISRTDMGSRQSVIVHYLFGTNGIGSVLAPYLEFNMKRDPAYGSALLRTCKLVRANVRLAISNALFVADWRAQMLQYWFRLRGQEGVLERIRQLGGVLRDTMDKFEPEDWSQWTLRSVRLRRVEGAAAGLYDWRGTAFMPVKILGTEIFYVDPTYNKRYLKGENFATRHPVAAILERSPYLFDMDHANAGWNRMYDLREPRITYRGSKELQTGCGRDVCDVCEPQGGKGWVYVSDD